MAEDKHQQMEEETEQLTNLGSLNISQMIKSSQSSHGLKHSDYGRYRKYCVERVKRLRKGMKFNYGRRYQNKDILNERKNDPKVLQVLLYNAEKNWAFAMHLKSKQTSEIKGKKQNKRSKFHLRNKFKKAVQWSQKLESVCAERTEKRTALEAEAYSAFLEGMYHFEIEEWEQAQSAFLKCRSIFSEILKVSDSLQGVLYREKIDQLDQSIRYCNHKASKGKKQMSVEEILAMRQQIKDPALSSKLEELLDEHRQHEIQQKQGLLEVEYHGEKLPIKNTRVILIIQKIQELNYNVEINSENIIKLYQELDKNINQIIELYDQNFENYISLFSLYDEANKLVAKDKEDPQNSEAEKTIFTKVLSYLTMERSLAVLNRNDNHTKQAILKFIKEDGLNNLQNLSTKKALKQRLTTPQEIVKHFDNYQQVLKQIMDIERMNPDITLFKKLDVLEFFSKGTRCFFVACLYFSNGKYQECVSLLKYTEDLLRVASRKFQENLNLFQNINLDVFIQVIPQLSSQLLLQSKLNALKESHQSQQQIGTQLQQMSLDKQSDNNLQDKHTLFSYINEKDSTVNLNLDNIQKFKLADLSSKMKLIVPRSIQFDLAYNQLQYPQLEEKKKGGFWGKLNIFKK